MRIVSVRDVACKDNPHGVEARTIYDHDHALISILTMAPGQHLKKHVTPVDVAFYVLEGRGEVEIGDEKETVGQDTMVESPKGIPHMWRNVGDAQLRIMVIKLPKPLEKSRMM